MPLTLVELLQLHQAHWLREAQQLVSQEPRRPFDLAAGPLLRTTLLKRSQEEHILVLCIHHAVFDGWSNRVFFEALLACYRALLPAGPSFCPRCHPVSRFYSVAAGVAGR